MRQGPRSRGARGQQERDWQRRPRPSNRISLTIGSNELSTDRGSASGRANGGSSIGISRRGRCGSNWSSSGGNGLGAERGSLLRDFGNGFLGGGHVVRVRRSAFGCDGRLNGVLEGGPWSQARARHETNFRARKAAVGSSTAADTAWPNRRQFEHLKRRIN